MPAGPSPPWPRSPLVGVGPLVDAVTASAHGSLPPRTAAQLLVDVRTPGSTALSGTVVETTDLGLPALPASPARAAAARASPPSSPAPTRCGSGTPVPTGSGSPSSASSASPTWSATARTSGPGRATTTPPPTGPSRPAARHADGAWSRPSARDDPATGRRGGAEGDRPDHPGDHRPDRLGRRPPGVRAGRWRRATPRSLVGSVRIAIDGATHIPTRVQVFAQRRRRARRSRSASRRSRPRRRRRRSSGSTRRPARPSSRAAVPRSSSRPHPRSRGHRGRTRRRRQGLDHRARRAAAREPPAAGPSGLEPGSSASSPPVSGSWGSGHLLRSALFSAVLTDDGRVAIGAVPPQMLYAALARR